MCGYGRDTDLTFPIWKKALKVRQTYQWKSTQAESTKLDGLALGGLAAEQKRFRQGAFAADLE